MHERTLLASVNWVAPNLTRSLSGDGIPHRFVRRPSPINPLHGRKDFVRRILIRVASKDACSRLKRWPDG
jgi:hypothetical protein